MFVPPKMSPRRRCTRQKQFRWHNQQRGVKVRHMKHLKCDISSLALLVLLAAATTASAGTGHLRDGWQIGLSYGYSPGQVTLANDRVATANGGATPQLRVNHSLGQHTAVGLEYNGWMLEGGDAAEKIRVSLQQVSLAGTWYPGQQDRTSGGFYLRAGVGLAWASLARITIVDQIQEHGARTDETGLGILGSLGYEFRVSRSFAAGIAVGLDHLVINKSIYDSGWYTPATMTLSWYWD